MDDLAYQSHEYLLEISTPFSGEHLVLIPTTDIVKKFAEKQQKYLAINQEKASW